jgi:RNA polymerase sigma-70 factor (ECF subfamily)
MDPSFEVSASTITPQLVARAANGESHALSQLYDQSSTVLFSLALRILGDREQAADVLLEIYLDVWRKVVRYDVGRGTPIAWLITLTRNRAISRLRAQGLRHLNQIDASGNDDRTNQLVDRPSSSLDSQADQNLRHLIKEAWALLPPLQRQAIELAYYEGLSDTEIAARLNESVRAVRTSITLGMSQLHQSLQSDWQRDEAV